MKSTGQAAVFTIGEVAERFDLATHVLRHWESQGLLRPGRSPGGGRRYGPSDLYRVAVILRAKEAGFSLARVRRILRSTPEQRTGLMRRQRDELRARIAAMRASLDLIEGALRCDHEDLAECPKFQSLVAERAGIANAGEVLDRTLFKPHPGPADG
ncbi:MAG TPA: MerR family transcriptional regulator [Segeticoccus sp.]|nr:MerR family transcriptional regulator [Segeticoccus sp.]